MVYVIDTGWWSIEGNPEPEDTQDRSGRMFKLSTWWIESTDGVSRYGVVLAVRIPNCPSY